MHTQAAHSFVVSASERRHGEYRQFGRDSRRVHLESPRPLFLLFFLSAYPPPTSTENPFIKQNQRSGKYPAERTTVHAYICIYVEYDFSKDGDGIDRVSPSYFFSIFSIRMLKFSNIILIRYIFKDSNRKYPFQIEIFSIKIKSTKIIIRRIYVRSCYYF